MWVKVRVYYIDDHLWVGVGKKTTTFEQLDGTLGLSIKLYPSSFLGGGVVVCTGQKFKGVSCHVFH